MKNKIITWDNWCEWCGTWMFNTFNNDEWDKFLDTATEIYNSTDFAFHHEDSTHRLVVDVEIENPKFIERKK